MKYLLIAITCLLFANKGYSQENTELLQLIADAEYFYNSEDYEQALPIYKKVLEIAPDNANINYKVGMCYHRMPFEAGRSINYLEKASKNVSRFYYEGDYKEERAPLETFYFLAYAYHNNKYYDEALTMYSRYRDSLAVTDVYSIQVVERQLLSCKTAKDISKNPVSVEIYNIGNVINTAYADFNPCVTSDGNTIFFTRVIPIEHQEEVTTKTLRIFTANRIDEEHWTKPEDITDQLGTKGECKVVSVNADGTMLVLYKDPWLGGGITDVKGGALYFSKKTYRTDAKWPLMTPFNKIINSKNNETHASISPDGKKLYFTSDRKGGYGGLDIYVSELVAGEWAAPKNLGPTINTPFDEETPFILDDGKTLYFASEGHYNMGGFDIFSAKMVEYDIWTEPVNMGVPINSPDDNIFFAPAQQGKLAYYAVARNEGYFTFGDMDIYELLILSFDEYQKGVESVIKGKVEFEDNKPFDNRTRIYVTNKEGNVVDTIIPKADGTYRTKLFAGEYKFTYECPGYKKFTKVVNVDKALIEKFITVNSSFTPDVNISDKKYYVIRNIYFDENQSIFTREAQIELEKIKTLMVENPSLYIEVIGHTDSKGSEEQNKLLAQKRSRAVIEYLVKSGIEEFRFVSTAAGESKKLAEDVAPDGSTVEEAARFNRRVEIKVIKTDDNTEILVENVPLANKNQKFNRYSVQIDMSAVSVDPLTYKGLNDTIKVMKALIKPNTYVYYFGEFKNKADAIKYMNYAISKGYKSAKVIDYYTLNSEAEFTITNPVPYKKKYTIQLQALAKQQILTTNPILVEATQYKTEDGYFRYTYKEYDDITDAQNDLIKIMDAGFNNAFIVEIKDLKN